MSSILYLILCIVIELTYNGIIKVDKILRDFFGEVHFTLNGNHLSRQYTMPQQNILIGIDICGLIISIIMYQLSMYSFIMLILSILMIIHNNNYHRVPMAIGYIIFYFQ